MSKIGQRFGSLTVVSKTSSGYWCTCDCGSGVDLPSNKLNSKRKFCANDCPLRIQFCRDLHTTHGASHSRMWNTWHNLKARCYNRENPQYMDYGGRGVTVCDKWRESFETFAADVGDPPTARHTLDRENNDKGYEPGNVRWATRKEQNENRRNTHWVEYEGEKITLKELSRKTGIVYETLRWRYKHGKPLLGATPSSEKFYGMG